MKRIYFKVSTLQEKNLLLGEQILSFISLLPTQSGGTKMKIAELAFLKVYPFRELTLLNSEQPKLNGVLAVLSAIGLKPPDTCT